MNKDQQALFREALEGNEKRIWSVCSYYFVNRDDARDAYQEILIKIWMNIHRFRGEALLSTWITRIAVNVCLTFLSKAKKDREIFSGLPQSGYPDPDPESEPDRQLEEDKLSFFRAFTSQLPPADRMLVSLYLGEMDYREISEATGLTEVNARTRIHRIKGQIKKEWEEKYGTR